MERKNKFQKMWGAHAMGVFWGDLVAHNFSKENPYKNIAGINEKDVVFYFHKDLGTEFYNSVPEINASAIIGEKRFSDKNEFEVYLSNSKAAILRADEMYFSVIRKELASLSKEDLLESLKSQADAFQEIYSYYHACQPQYFIEIEKNIKDYLTDEVQIKDVDYYIGLLTSQEELDVILKEEMEWLSIAKEIQSRNLDRKSIKADLEIFEKLNGHIDKYMSLGSGEGGRAWDGDYYWNLFEKIDFDIDEKIKEVLAKKKSSVEEKRFFIEKNEISKEIVDLANISGKIGTLRLEIRLSWMRLSHTLTNNLLVLGEKMKNLYTPADILEITLAEIKEIVEKNKPILSTEEIDKRKKSFLFVVENEEKRLLVGDEAIEFGRKLLPSKNIEVLEIKGSVACRGVVSGRVYVIDWKDQGTQRMEAMKRGDILVAGQTRPQLMPAIKKASAIITDEGGIMCHAAIVSRELGIPCIIGTKIATQVLQDGDLVEVDANEGVVRIKKANNTES